MVEVVGTPIEAARAAELLGVDIYTLGGQMRCASADAFMRVAERVKRRGENRDRDPLDLTDDIEAALNLLRAAEACDTEWWRMLDAD